MNGSKSWDNVTHKILVGLLATLDNEAHELSDAHHDLNKRMEILKTRRAWCEKMLDGIDDNRVCYEPEQVDSLLLSEADRAERVREGLRKGPPHGR